MMSDGVGETARTERITLGRAQPEIAKLAPWIAAAAETLPIPRSLVFAVQLCLEEAVTNVIEHGAGAGGPEPITIALARHGDTLTARIEDDGPPFDPTRAEPRALAETVAEAASGGFGLRLIRQHARTASYERAAERNCLTLTFQASLRPAEADAAAPNDRDARLLVVDDNEDNRYVLSSRLRRLGYANLASAVDGVEALAMIAAQPFDAIFLDVMMPRMNGIEVLERLRAEGRLEASPVIMVSAATELDTVVRCIELGAEDYLPKPFNPVLLRARLGAVLEKRKLRAALRAALDRFEAELAEARRLQLNMVPSEFPTFAGGNKVEVHAVMRPAREIGGDLFDCFAASADILCVALGDVSGKGTPAALFMARARSLLRAATLAFLAISGRMPLPSELARIINEELCKDNADCMFVTLFIGFLDLGTRELSYVNAGHLDPLLLHRDGTVETLAGRTALPFGVMATAQYPDRERALDPGDGLLVLSDGLPEMMNEAGAFYTLERIRGDLRELGRESPGRLVAALIDRILAFGGAAVQYDDMTALALRLSP
jgi:phosphoserine phosphatase RsbU/P